MAPAFGQWGQEFLTEFDSPPFPDNSLTDFELRTGDIDGDGRLDVVLMHPYAGSFRWLRNTPSGDWPATYVANDIFDTTSTWVFEWEVADVDSDGDLDIIAGGSPANVATVWMENQAGGTQWQTHVIPVSVGETTVGIEMADLDGDGDKDLVLLARTWDDAARLYEATPQGFVFSHVLDMLPFSNDTRIVLEDIDGDGDMDFALSDTNMATTVWHENHSTPGQFLFVPTIFPIPSKTTHTVDWNGDGNLDLVETELRSIQIRLNTSPGTFGAPIEILNGAIANVSSIRISRIEVADMDGDGDEDLVFRWGSVGSYCWQSIVENNSDGSPGLRTEFSQEGWNHVENSWSVIDYDGDGDQDIVETKTFLDIELARNLRTYGVQSACQALPNSTGLVGHLSVTGSGYAELNATTLTASQLRVGQPTLFLIGDTDTTGIIPPGSQGAFCLGGSFGRFNRVGEIKLSNAQGLAQFTPDLTNTPSPMGTETILSGESKTFQAWFRDFDMNGGSTSNFTDAVVVTFD